MWPTRPKESNEYLSTLAASGRPAHEVVASTLNYAFSASINYAQTIAQIVTFYLEDNRSKELAALIEVCKGNDEKSNELLKGYVREGVRLNPPFSALQRIVAQDDSISQGEGFKPLLVTKGDILLTNFKNANLNVSIHFCDVPVAHLLMTFHFSLTISRILPWSIQLARRKAIASKTLVSLRTTLQNR